MIFVSIIKDRMTTSSGEFIHSPVKNDFINVNRERMGPNRGPWGTPQKRCFPPQLFVYNYWNVTQKSDWRVIFYWKVSRSNSQDYLVHLQSHNVLIYVTSKTSTKLKAISIHSIPSLWKL